MTDEAKQLVDGLRFCGMHGQECLDYCPMYDKCQGRSLDVLERACAMIERLSDLLDKEIAFNSKLVEAFKERRPERQEEQAIGTWLHDRPGRLPICSRCRKRSAARAFCPHCGAEIRGEARAVQNADNPTT